MELKFSVSEKLDINEIRQPFFQPQNGTCNLSCENIAIFTRVLYHSNTFKQNIPVYTVYVADLNTLYEPYVIMESLEQITRTKFDSSGQKLVIVTSLGKVHFYSKGAALHQWTNTFTRTWNGEEIICVEFFHPKNKPCIQLNEKIKLQTPYSEKFNSKPHEPTLKTTGDCFQNGFFVISASGLVMACAFNTDGSLEEEGKAFLGPVRDNFEIAAIALAPSGSIHIAAYKPDILKCWEVELKYVENERPVTKDGKIYGGISINGNRKMTISVQSAQSLTPLSKDTVKSNMNIEKVPKVSHLQYLDTEDPSSLLLVLELEKKSLPMKMEPNSTIKEMNMDSQCLKSYVVQKYRLVDKTRIYPQFFQDLVISKDASEIAAKVKEWTLQGEWSSQHRILCLNTSSRQLFTGSIIPNLIIVSTTDGTIHSIHRDTLCTLGEHNFVNKTDEMPPMKKCKTNKQVVSLAPTWSNLHVLTQDSQGDLHFLTLLKQLDVGTQWVLSIMMLLEYSLVSEYDWWDILMVTPLNSIMNIVEKFSDTFHQQPTPVVSNLLSRFLVFKNSMYRLCSNLHQRSIEARLQAQLSAILKLYHSLRPVTTDVCSGEKNLVTSIQKYVESRNSLDVLDLDKAVENILFSFNILDCQIDPAIGRDLQVLLQYSTDLALYLLLLLVQNPKFELAKDPKTLLYLREILLTSRLWYRHNKLVVPQMIKKSDSVDIWAQLYKLLTRLSQILPSEPDTGFLDDCVILETQVVCREVPLFIPPRGIFGCVAASTISNLPFPLYFTFDQNEPSSSTSSVNPRPLEGSLPPSQPLDALCYQYLGGNTTHLQCTRCFALRGSWSFNGEPSMWEQEWATKCICSGYWVQSPA